MDFDSWQSRINSLSIYQSVKDNIINFFRYFSNDSSFSFIKIEEEKIINSLNNINNYRTVTICMDAEFQTTLVGENSNFISYENFFGNQAARFPRELGMLFFLKDSDNFWFYVGHIFVNFNGLTNYGFDEIDTRLIESTFSTVTDKTFQNMERNEEVFRLDKILDELLDKHMYQNENKFNKTINRIIDDFQDNFIFNNFLRDDTKVNLINKLHGLKSKSNFNEVEREIKYIKRPLSKVQYEIYGRYLLDEYYERFLTNQTLYWNDKLVLERLKLLDGKETIFFNILSKLSEESIYLVKGMMDFQALKNMYRLIFNTKKDKIKFENYYDIEFFNGISNNLFKSSRLEETYNNLIKTKIYNDNAKELFSEIKRNIGGKAHNPIADSLFTIVVAIVINLALNDFFSKDKGLKQKGGSNSYVKYLKYKKEYLNIKKKTYDNPYL